MADDDFHVASFFGFKIKFQVCLISSIVPVNEQSNDCGTLQTQYLSAQIKFQSAFVAAICNQNLIDFRVPQADNSNHELQLAHETLRMYQSLEKAADLSSKLLLVERHKIMRK